MTPRLSIVTRLTVGALSVLLPATLILGVGGWWLMRRSLVGATDSHLSARIDGVRRYIDGMEREPPPEGFQDELHEYTELAEGDVLLEVVDASDRMLCGPLIAGWDVRELESRLRTTPVGTTVFVDTEVRGAPFRVAGARVRSGADEFRIVTALPMGPSVEALRRFTSVLAGALPLLLVVAGLGSYWISRRALTPVDRVTRTVRAITVHDLDRRLDVPLADDELSRLIVTFNDMLARLERAVADMARFTAEAAHELRTPVTLVRTTAELALGRDRTADEYREALGDVLVHGEQMSVLVTDLLELARADAGVEPREPAMFDLRDIVNDAAREVAPAMARRSLVLTLELAERPIEIRGDPESLRRLLFILLDNALKYSLEGGAVRLVVGAEPGAVVIEVIDTGIGIALEDRSRLFDRFYRGANARLHAADGSGLGLPIARVIVVRHGGTIDVDAGPGGVGCRVRVRLART